MIVRILVGFLGVLLFFDVQAQQASPKNVSTVDFVLHLIEIGAIDEAEALTKTEITLQGDTTVSDSLYYIIGKAFLENGNYAIALKNFLRISANSVYYYPSRFFSSNCYLKLDKVDSAKIVLQNTYLSTNDEINELLDFELAGALLLKNNYGACNSLLSRLDSSAFLALESKDLRQLSNQRSKLHHKSRFVAGFMSAIVPGLGKLYAGNRAQGLATFLRVSILGAVAVENIIKKGYDDPSSLLFSGIFAMFYVGNIWGSAMNVHIIKNEKKVENNYNIMVSLQLPINRFFK